MKTYQLRTCGDRILTVKNSGGEHIVTIKVKDSDTKCIELPPKGGLDAHSPLKDDFNKPTTTTIRFSILELSKLIMYTFYEHLKAKYGTHCTLLFTDTDSLYCHIKTGNLYVDMEICIITHDAI